MICRKVWLMLTSGNWGKTNAKIAESNIYRSMDFWNTICKIYGRIKRHILMTMPVRHWNHYWEGTAKAPSVRLVLKAGTNKALGAVLPRTALQGMGRPIIVSCALDLNVTAEGWDRGHNSIPTQCLRREDRHRPLMRHLLLWQVVPRNPGAHSQMPSSGEHEAPFLQ